MIAKVLTSILVGLLGLVACQDFRLQEAAPILSHVEKIEARVYELCLKDNIAYYYIDGRHSTVSLAVRLDAGGNVVKCGG